jgi:amino acid adenylation domain-containing protein/non-ribosomal peptide synthase protein (TIGR01720 family)
MDDLITRESPASPAQIRAWTLAQTLAQTHAASVEPKRAAPNHVGPWCVEPWRVTATLRIEGPVPIDHDRLTRAIARTIARHEILRTEIKRRPGLRVPVQVIGDAGVLGSGLRVTTDADGSTTLSLSLPATHADMPSLVVFARDLAAYYSENDPMDEAFQYADHVAYESELLDSDAGADGLQRWRARLSSIDGIDGVVENAGNERRGGDGAFAPARERARMSSAAREGLARIADRTGQPIEIVWASACAVLLWRLGDGRHTAFGMASPCRDFAEFDGLIGPLEKHLPVVAAVRADDTLAVVVARIAAAIADAREWASVYVPERVWPSRVDGMPSGLPVALAYYDATERISAGDLTLRVTDMSTCVDRVELQIVASDHADGLDVDVTRDPAVVTHQTSALVLEGLNELLVHGADALDRAITSLRVISDATEARWIARGRGEDVSEPAPSVPARIASWAASAPARLAVRSGSASLTYAAMDVRASAVARGLRALGVTRERRVGIVLPRGIEFVVACLGVWKAGGAYVPIDPSWPAARVAQVLDDAGIEVVVTDRARAERMPTRGVHVLLLEAGEIAAPVPATGAVTVTAPADVDAAADAAADATWPAVFPGQAGYVLYTSGSTGKPKGVLVPHAALSQYVAWAIDAYDVASLPWAPWHTSASFDLSVTSLWVPLSAGQCVEAIAGEANVDALTEVGAALQAGASGLVKLTPAHLRALRTTWNATGLPPGPPRTVVVGGEALNYGDVVGWAGIAGVQVINEYGPTETTVGCCVAEVAPSDALAADAPVPIGRPIAGTTLYLVDARGALVPHGAVGELWIGGAGVARGYHGRAALTAASFVPDPWGSTGARVYRSGDRARWRDDGQLEYLGRRDGQVKIRGYRIEPGEVEQVVRTHAAVADGAVVARATPDGLTQLIAYVSPRLATEPHAPLDGAALRRWVAERLPEYMVPAAVVVVDRLPVTSNGKLDRRALVALEPTTPTMTRPAADREPRTVSERVLLDVWRDVLGRASIGVEDNFFELGGDSILSIQIVARARMRGVHLAPRDLFRHQTIEALAAAADATAGEALGPAAAAVSVSSGPVPLTPIQRAFFAQAHPERHHFNQSLVLASREPVAVPALAAALTAVVAHHAALRLRFGEAPDGWYAWLPSAAAARWPAGLVTVDLRQVSTDAHARVWLAMVTEAERSLDLTKGPLLRVVVVRTREDDRVLLIAHHLVMDGVSWRVLLDDLARTYADASRGAPIGLGRASTDWATWATALATCAAGPALAAEREYWADVVGANADADGPGASVRTGVLAAPATRAAQGPALQGRAARVQVRLTPSETEALVTGVARHWHASTEAALLAAVGTALSASAMPAPGSTADEWVIDLEGHGREHEAVDPRFDLSRTIGWFTTMYPVRVPGAASAPTGGTWRAVVQEIHARLAAVPHRGLRYGLLRWAPGAVAWPAAVASVNYQGLWDRVLAAEGPFAAADDPTGPVASPLAERAHALAINAQVWRDQLRVQITYDPARHQEIVEPMQSALIDALRGIAAETRTEPRRLVDEFPLAGVDEQQLQRVLASAAARQGGDVLDPLATDLP